MKPKNNDGNSNGLEGTHPNGIVQLGPLPTEIDPDDGKIGLVMLLGEVLMRVPCDEIERHLRIVDSLYDELPEEKKDVVDNIFNEIYEGENT